MEFKWLHKYKQMNFMEVNAKYCEILSEFYHFRAFISYCPTSIYLHLAWLMFAKLMASRLQQLQINLMFTHQFQPVLTQCVLPGLSPGTGYTSCLVFQG